MQQKHKKKTNPKKTHILKKKTLKTPKTLLTPNILNAKLGVLCFTLQDRIEYHIPDVLGAQQAMFKNGHHLVVGAGFSSITTVKKLMELRAMFPQTKPLTL